MIGSFGDDHTKMLFEKGKRFRFPKEFTKAFTSDKGIISKTRRKLKIVNDATSLSKIRELTPGSELEKKKSDEKNGNVYCMRIDNQYRMCFRESYNRKGILVVKELEITNHYKNSKLFPEGYRT